MKRFVLFGLASLLAAPTLAHAQRVSPMKAGTFGQICTHSKSLGLCDAYLSGMIDAGTLSKINDTNQGDADAPAGFCVPTSETTPAIRAKVVSWLKQHSDALPNPLGEVVFKALQDAYPCGAKK
ncbi:MAG: Rap1a/Tai family immunity protein [Acetobacter sp.]